MTIRIRPLQPNDEPRWRELFAGYIAFYQSSVAETLIAQTWARIMSGGEGCHIGLGAVDDEGRLIGIAHVLFHRSTWSPTCYCYLEDLFVDPVFRRGGAGAALIEATYREADLRGATRTYWVTQEANSAARALYDRYAAKAPFVQYRR